METKNINIDIKTYIKSSPPLETIYKDNKIILKYDSTNIIEISFHKDTLNYFELKFFHEYNIISPVLDNLNNSYKINYSNIPLDKKFIKDFRKIIIKLNKYFLLFEIGFNNIFSIINNYKKNILNLKFSQLFGLNIKINLFNNLDDYYSSTVNKNLLPLWTFAPGIIIDYEKKTNQPIFSKLKECLKNDYLNIIIKNWMVEDFVLYNNKEKINKLKRYLGKLSLNKINFVLHFDNKINKKNHKNFHILKLRKGTPVENSGKISLDYYSNDGQTELTQIYKKIFELGCKGIFLNSIYYQFNNEDLLNKTICKTEKAFIPYSKYVQLGLKFLNKIIGNFKDKIFFSNVLSNEINNSVFLDIIDDNINIILKKIEEFYRQGFINFGAIINKTNINIVSKIPNPEASIFLIFNLIYIDNDIITDITTKENIVYEKFISIIKTRMMLRVLFDNLILDFTEMGILPVRGYYSNNELVGYTLGKYIYCSFLKERLLDSIFYLPSGKWYSIKNSILIEGEGYYKNKEKNEQFHLFQKENTIIELIEDSVYNDYFNPGKIKFSIFPEIKIIKKTGSVSINNLTQNITERILTNEKEAELNHLFNISQKKDSINIKYENKIKHNLNRTIIFHMVTNDLKIVKIISNNKKVIYKEKDNKPFIEFELINRKNKISIDIYYK